MTIVELGGEGRHGTWSVAYKKFSSDKGAFINDVTLIYKFSNHLSLSFTLLCPKPCEGVSQKYPPPALPLLV